MGFASAYDVWVAPMMRDWATFMPMFEFYFVLQIALKRTLPNVIKCWPRLTNDQRDDLIIRICSCANGLIMSISAVIFVKHLYINGGTFPADLYAPLPEYTFNRIAITSYFAWDVVVCFYYKWTWAWKLHGIFSFLGTYTLNFPFANYYAGYYTGCFEMSNAFLHISIILRMLADTADKVTEEAMIKKYNMIATCCEYVFGLLYFLIRVVGGTYVTYSWLKHASSNLYVDYVNGSHPGHKFKTHDELAVILAMLCIITVQILQYVWFVEIVKRALGMGPAAKVEESATTTEDKKEEEKKKE